MARRPEGRAPSRQGGFILIFLLVLLTMGILYTLVNQLDPAQYRAGQTGTTADALAQAKAALIGYAATYRDDPAHSAEVFGYLPCPDSTGNGQADGSCGAPGTTVVGLLPYKTLGLPDLRDSSGNCLWYAVSGSHKNNLPTAPLNWDTQGLIQVQDASGNVVVKPDDANGGAAAVIFAAGPPLPGQNRTPNTAYPCNANPAEYAAYLDGVPAFPSAANPVVITHGTPDILGAANNDQVLWITAKEIFDRVIQRADFGNGLADSPVGQINKLADQVRAVLEKRIQDDLVAGGTLSSAVPANTASYAQVAGRQIGELGTLTPSDATYTNYVANWSNQFRQAACSPLNSCLTVNGTACRGALIFAGRATNNQPRPSSQQASSTANLGYYFESGLGILNGTSTSFTGNSAYLKASPSADVGTCLFPGTFLSFAQDIGGFAGGLVTSAGGGNPVATVDTGTQSVTLGSTTSGTGTARSGCVWYPSAIPLNSMMRVYFRFQVATRGRGFTMAIADASTNNPANTRPVMCGSTGSSHLGYAGAPPTGQVIGPSSSADIASASWSGGTATITTVGAHGLSTGNFATITGVLPDGYNNSGNPVQVTVLSSTRFWYSLTSDPGSSPAGIKPPKLAIEFDTHQDSSRLDPSADHAAFVYWGGTADSGATGNGNDDNTHYAGVLGSGAQPLNPRELDSTPPTATPIDASLSTPKSATVTDLSAGIATTSTAHGFTAGQWVSMSGFSSVSCNGLYPITAVAGNTFSLPPGNTSTCSSGGFATATAPIAAASWSSATGTGKVAVTTSTAHNLVDDQYVNIANVYPAGYNGTYQVKVTGTSTFTYTLAASPGGTSTGTSSKPGIVTVATLNPVYLSSPDGSAMPTTTSATPYNNDSPHDGVIHVRLDISRSYDATAHRASISMKAYVADRFDNYDSATGIWNTCTVADFKNLGLDLSSLCTQGAYIEQDGIPINDISAPAFANVIFGFTTGRGSSSSDNEDVVISNFLLRSQ